MWIQPSSPVGQKKQRLFGPVVTGILSIIVYHHVPVVKRVNTSINQPIGKGHELAWESTWINHIPSVKPANI